MNICNIYIYVNRYILIVWIQYKPNLVCLRPCSRTDVAKLDSLIATVGKRVRKHAHNHDMFVNMLVKMFAKMFVTDKIMRASGPNEK